MKSPIETVFSIAQTAILIAMLTLAYIFFADSMGVKSEKNDLLDKQAKEAQAMKDAIDFCMQWKIKEADVIDGEKYCRMEVNIPFAGVVYTVSQWYSEDEMWLQNGLLLKAVTPQP